MWYYYDSLFLRWWLCVHSCAVGREGWYFEGDVKHATDIVFSQWRYGIQKTLLHPIYVCLCVCVCVCVFGEGGFSGKKGRCRQWHRLTASPHWSRKFGKLHGNLISAAALCSPAEPRPGAGRHMCDGLPTDIRWPVSEAGRGQSLLVLWLSEPV